MLDSADAAAAPEPLPRIQPVGIALSWLVAALPGLLILQVLPRAIDPGQAALAAPVLAFNGALLPLGGAALGGLIAAMSRGSWRWVAGAGVASQLPALPGFVNTVAGALGAGYVGDTGVYVALYSSLAVTACWLAYFSAAGWRKWTAASGEIGERSALNWPVSIGLIALAVLYLALAVILLTNPQAPLPYGLWLALGASVASFGVARCGASWVRQPAGVVVVAGVGVLALTAVLTVGSFLES